jgi:thiamine biosynthesis lipoprotein
VSTEALGGLGVPTQRTEDVARQRTAARRPKRRQVPDYFERHAWVQQVMGMPVSVHARGSGAREPEADAAVAALFEDLHAFEAVFSTHRPDSQVSRLQRGEVRLDDCDEDVRDVHRLCLTARTRTNGAFDAWAAVPGSPGLFDPTGLVKSWALSRAARRLDAFEDLAFAVGAGGDILVSPGSTDLEWVVGIEDPRDRHRIVATIPVRDGAVATSGVAARGMHILDPFTGQPAAEVLSATVIGPSLVWADVFATAAVALGRDALDWVQTLHGTSGLLLLADGSTHRWQNEP